MTRYVALLRAVNVGGTGKLPMSELKAAAGAAGFEDISTYIASGNCLFSAEGSEAELQLALSRALLERVGARIGILIRSAGELAAVVTDNPFADRDNARTMAIFLDHSPAPDAATDVRGLADESIAVVGRELYVHYPSGMGQSKLKIRAAVAGTARNMNTVAKLAALCATRSP